MLLSQDPPAGEWAGGAGHHQSTNRGGGWGSCVLLLLIPSLSIVPSHGFLRDRGEWNGTSNTWALWA